MWITMLQPTVEKQKLSNFFTKACYCYYLCLFSKDLINEKAVDATGSLKESRYQVD